MKHYLVIPRCLTLDLTFAHLHFDLNKIDSYLAGCRENVFLIGHLLTESGSVAKFCTIMSGFCM